MAQFVPVQFESLHVNQRKGRVWVLAEQAIVIGDPVYLRHTLGTPTQTPGRFRKDADAGRADGVAAARWVTGTSAPDALAQLEINLP